MGCLLRLTGELGGGGRQVGQDVKIECSTVADLVVTIVHRTVRCLRLEKRSCETSAPTKQHLDTVEQRGDVHSKPVQANEK